MKVTLADALAAYSRELASHGLAANTIRCQTGYLHRFRRTCQLVAREKSAGRRTELWTTELSPDCLARFFDPIKGQGNRNNALVAFRKFFAWLERMEYIGHGKADWLLSGRKHKTAAREPKYYIPVDHFADMLDFAEERHPVERAQLALALYTLARGNSEIAGLRLKHLDLQARTLQVYRQKRKRWTEVAISPDLLDELTEWLGIYASLTDHSSPQAMISEHPDWYLVPRLEAERVAGPDGRYDAKLTRFSVNPELPAIHLERLVKRMLDKTGAQTAEGKWVRHKGEGMHTIRRSGARAMLDHLSLEVGQDKALLRVATMLDHEDPQQTLAYIGMDIERKQLNDWLKDNPMYGSRMAPRRQRGAVIPIRETDKITPATRANDGQEVTSGVLHLQG